MAAAAPPQGRRRRCRCGGSEAARPDPRHVELLEIYWALGVCMRYGLHHDAFGLLYSTIANALRGIGRVVAPATGPGSGATAAADAPGGSVGVTLCASNRGYELGTTRIQLVTVRCRRRSCSQPLDRSSPESPSCWARRSCGRSWLASVGSWASTTSSVKAGFSPVSLCRSYERHFPESERHFCLRAFVFVGKTGPFERHFWEVSGTQNCWRNPCCGVLPLAPRRANQGKH